MHKKYLRWLAVVLWCAFIFYQSALPGAASGEKSMAVAKFVNHILSAITGVDRPLVSEIMVRKTAHFIEYFILGILLLAAVSDYINIIKTRALPASWIFGLCYSLSDEIHQYFVPGRSMRMLDVLIDTTGVIAGTVMLYCILKWKRGMLVVEKTPDDMKKR